MSLKDLDIKIPDDVRKMVDEMDDVLTYKGSLDGIKKDRVSLVLNVYQSLSDAFKGQDVKVTYNLFRPSKEKGSVEVTGKRVEFSSSSALLSAVHLADAFDMAANIDNSVTLSFTFNGLM